MESKINYDSFNARDLSFQQVADSFIINDYFEKLIDNNHSLLMGPRGCGKTTLLKMLTPSALYFWDKKRSSNLFESISFWSIYIPTDIHWKNQLDQLYKDLGNDNKSLEISKATITINILLSQIKAFSSIKSILEEKNEVDLTENEVTLSKLIIDNWELKKPIAPTFDSIEIYLLGRISYLNAESKKIIRNKTYILLLEDIIFSFHFFDLIKIACTLFEQIFKIGNTKRWSLCFDELEIAPEWLQLELLTSLRSRDQKIIFKLTTAPIISFLRKIKSDFNLDASENNDFNAIKIWTSNQTEFRLWTKFSEKLILSRTKRKYDATLHQSEILGNSNLNRVIKESFIGTTFTNEKDFQRNTPTWFIFKQLSKIDNSFNYFLKKKKINPSDPIPNSKYQEDSIFRKIKQIVTYRFQFKKEGSFKRSRKIVPLYYGMPLIYELCDGNPRILIRMIDDLAEIAFNSESKSFRHLTINEQSKVLVKISERYLQVISAHPDANIVINNKFINLSHIIEMIGQFFHKRMVDQDFSMDPVGSFIVDIELNNKILDLLELGVYLGALIYMDNEEPISSTGLINKRLRLSYILSPYFSLLSRDFKAINLSIILNSEKSNSIQSKLFK